MSRARTIAIDARKIADFGIGSYLRGLVEALVPRLGNEELLLLGDRGRAEQSAAPIRGVRWVEERSPLYSLRELWSVARTAERAGAALLHVPHYTTPVHAGLPVVITIHDLIHLRFPEHRTALHRLYARWMIGRALRDAAAVIAVSESTRRDLIERFGALAERVVTIPNGVDDRFFEPVPAAELARRLSALGLAPGYLLFVGNPLPHKNLPRLLEAYARVRTLVEGAPELVLAGSRSAHREALEALIERSGVAGRARVVPHLPAEQLPALYAGASLLVMPSLWEGFGLPAAEAMACGVPVVASDRGGLPEVVGEAGERIDPTSTEAIATRIAALLADVDRRNELSRIGRARARRFRWEIAASRTLEIYRQLLAETGEKR